MSFKSLDEKLIQLPEDIQKQAADFVDFLLEKHTTKNPTISTRPKKSLKKVVLKKGKNKMNFNWEGGLVDLKNKFSSVELQHHILKLRANEISR